MRAATNSRSSSRVSAPVCGDSVMDMRIEVTKLSAEGAQDDYNTMLL